MTAQEAQQARIAELEATVSQLSAQVTALRQGLVAAFCAAGAEDKLALLGGGAEPPVTGRRERIAASGLRALPGGRTGPGAPRSGRARARGSVLSLVPGSGTGAA